MTTKPLPSHTRMKDAGRKQVAFWVVEAELDKIKEAAAKSKQSLAAFFTLHSLRAAEKILK